MYRARRCVRACCRSCSPLAPAHRSPHRSAAPPSRARARAAHGEGARADVARRVRHRADWIDKGADPCSDFFAYACGGFVEDRAVSRPTARAWGAIQMVVKDERGVPPQGARGRGRAKRTAIRSPTRSAATTPRAWTSRRSRRPASRRSSRCSTRWRRSRMPTTAARAIDRAARGEGCPPFFSTRRSRTSPTRRR